MAEQPVDSPDMRQYSTGSHMHRFAKSGDSECKQRQQCDDHGADNSSDDDSLGSAAESTTEFSRPRIARYVRAVFLPGCWRLALAVNGASWLFAYCSECSPCCRAAAETVTAVEAARDLQAHRREITR